MVWRRDAEVQPLTTAADVYADIGGSGQIR
jgi:hypothetical protein